MAQPWDTALIPQEANRAAKLILDSLADHIIGIYLYGSSIEDGLQRHSDIDLFVVTNTALSTAVRKKLTSSFMDISGEIGNKKFLRPLEITIVNLYDLIPWAYPPRRELQFGEWLRPEIEKGLVLEAAQDPDLTILLKQVVQKNAPLIGPQAFEILPSVPDSDFRKAILDTLPLLLQSIAGDERNSILTLARMYYSLITRQITSKHRATTWLLTELPDEFHSLLNDAKLAYLGKHTDCWKGRESEIQNFVTFMALKIELHRE